MLINRDKCLYCGGCVGVCPVDAITLNEVILLIDDGKCTRCGICVKYCPVGALKLPEAGK
jgi:ferredoxin